MGMRHAGQRVNSSEERAAIGILSQLSSQVGDRSEYSNRKVVLQCLDRPSLLAEIVRALESTDAALLGDCAEVLTMVAETRPELVAPHAKALAARLTHPTTRVRWESMHALALVAPLAPRLIGRLLPQLGDLVRCDSSVIVRDYAVDAIAAYARSGPKAARAACPYLKEALTTWCGKQAAHALNGLANVALVAPRHAGELHAVGERYLDDRRGVVRKAAKALVRATEKK